jgi:hypothetical protein
MSSIDSEEDKQKVEVLFDFEYPTDSGKVVRMRKGEQLVVIKKTNPDWWRCRRLDDHSLDDHSFDDLFYAPVSYLKESVNHNNNNINDNNIDINCNNHKKKNISTIKVGLSFTNPLSSGFDDNNSEDHSLDKSNGTTNSSKESLIDDNESCDNNNQSLNESNSRTDSELSSVGIYANLPLINTNCPPVPNSKVSPIRILLNHWAEYEDNSGRKFYYNSLSRETSWKPPRRKPYHYSRDDELTTSHSEENLTDSSSTSLSTTPNKSVPKPKSRWRKFVKKTQFTDSLNAKSIQTSPPTLPKGWTRKHNEETKELYFINDQTNEKWFCKLDENGRLYFFEENGQESYWELPDVTPNEESSEVSIISINTINGFTIDFETIGTKDCCFSFS